MTPHLPPLRRRPSFSRRSIRTVLTIAAVFGATLTLSGCYYPYGYPGYGYAGYGYAPAPVVAAPIVVGGGYYYGGGRWGGGYRGWR